MRGGARDWVCAAQFLLVRFGWTPIAFDIKMAYINADIPEDEQVPIQFRLMDAFHDALFSDSPCSAPHPV